MQLKPPRPIVTSLAAATCALLGSGQAKAAEADAKPWTFDTAVLYYGETDRVTDISANILVNRLFSRSRKLTFRLAVDSLTGASASGAVPASAPQTFTTPSGNASYQTPAGETPLDDSFLDTRIALDVNWAQTLGARSGIELGASLSNEYDYFHGGLNAKFTHDFNQRNTTVIAGLAVGYDTISPVGGAPIPFAAMLPPGESGNKAGNDSKTVGDLVVGVTQVLGERTIGQINYSLSRSSGYLTDPYKLLSVVDPVTGEPVPGPSGLLYLYESRPDQRTKHSLYAEIRHLFTRDLVDASYRFMTDDWGVQSHTADLRYRFRLSRFYLEPHLRYYTQTAADFYRAVLFNGDSLPDHASADYRLGDLDAVTLGLQFGYPQGGGREWTARIEAYRQSGRSPPEARVGALQTFDLFPSVDALIIQTGYRF